MHQINATYEVTLDASCFDPKIVFCQEKEQMFSFNAHETNS